MATTSEKKDFGKACLKKINIKSEDSIIPFLIEDFKDTAEHQRVTDKKTEFLFQIAAGSIIALISAFLVIFQRLLENNSTKVYVILISIIIFFFFVAVEIWCYIVVLKGYKLKMTYINRMNLLRRRIYKSIFKNLSEIKPKEILYIDPMKAGTGGLGSMYLKAILALIWISTLISVIICFVAHDWDGILVLVPIFSACVLLGIAIAISLRLRCERKGIFKKIDCEVSKIWEAELE